MAPGVRTDATSGDRRRVGGRFWALAEEESGGEDDDGERPGSSSEYSPTPSDVICETFDPGYEEDEVAQIVEAVIPPEDPARSGLRPGENLKLLRRVVHRRTAASASRPWKDPIPKVIFRTTARIRSWSPLTRTEVREHLVTGSVRWEMVARNIFNRFGWQSCNRIGI
ncbi:uncharacterized protein LOC119367630 [Triticum dicoccoides]|uniref:uncharacterized protein LOC119367630 n=1 Tax=Triticum dicoccoides TaxID=85692 RepID=UPI001890573C|nr:uncharacterized protein LOC119367630 [Triticum dicoccoides]